MAIRRFDGPQRINDSLSALIKRFSRSDLEGIAALGDQWEALVGSELAEHSAPKAMRGSTLIIAVDQPARATQVRLSVGVLMARLSEVSGQAIEEIETTVKR